MAVKFPLKMSDGTSVRTIEELRKHFDLEAVLGYYSNGRLVEWLKDRYYDEEAEKVKDLEATSKKFNQKLCEILGVSYSEKADKKIDLSTIKRENERREILKKYTTDEKILSGVVDIAFTQKELDALLETIDALEKDADDNKVIYLCGEHFIIPANIADIIYRGINNPTVKFEGEIVEAGIDLQNLNFDISDYIKDCREDMIREAFKNNLPLGLKLLRQVAEGGDADAQFVFGHMCMDADIADMLCEEEPMEWFQKAADQGHIDANVYVYHFRLVLGLEEEAAEEAVKWFKREEEENRPYVDLIYGDLGKCYLMGIGVEQDGEKAVQYLKRAVEFDEDNGWESLPDVQYYLGFCYYYGIGIDQDYAEAFRWLQLAHNQEYMDAEVLLGMCYQFGRGVDKDSEKAVGMYRKRAEWYDKDALYLLGCCYFEGDGVEKSYEEAAKWIQKAINCGYEDEDAKEILKMCKWRSA